MVQGSSDKRTSRQSRPVRIADYCIFFAFSIASSMVPTM